MATPIQQDRNKKKTKKYVLIFGAIGYLIFTICFFHYQTIAASNPRYGVMDSISAIPGHILHSFFDIRLSADGLLYYVLFSILAFCFMGMAYSTKQLRKHDNPDTVNGSARFMTQDDLEDYNKRRVAPLGKKETDGPNNMIIAQDFYLAIDNRGTKRNCNIMIFGGSGAGKSFYFAAPNILNCNSNFVITDPSGDLLRDYGRFLQKQGYEILVFNLVDPYKGSRYNPFHYIREEKDVFILVDTLIKNTTPPNSSSSDPFWEKSEKMLIQAIMLLLWHKFPEKEQTFSSVMRLIRMAQISEDGNSQDTQSPLDLLFADLEQEDPENLAVKEYKNFKIGAGKTLKSILISVCARLEKFELAPIEYLTGTDELDLDHFSDKKKAMFVITPTGDTTFSFLVSMMYSQLFEVQYNYVENMTEFGWEAYTNDFNIVKVIHGHDKKSSKKAEKEIKAFKKQVEKGLILRKNKETDLYEVIVKETREVLTWFGEKEKAVSYIRDLKNLKIRRCLIRCPYHVRFILDEFANIGQIPDFDTKMSTIRKYDISCSIILQSLSQLKEKYEKNWNTIAGNCDTKLYLGTEDDETNEWFIKKFGKKTTTVENTSYQVTGNGGSSSYNKSGIELLTMDKLGVMKDDECIVKVRGELPFFGKKYNVLKHPNYKSAMEDKGKFILRASEVKRVEGPLRLRKANADVEEEATLAESITSATVTAEKKKEQQDMEIVDETPNSAKNKARKQEAEEAEKHLKEKQEKELQTTSMTPKELLTSIGISANSSDSEIKEQVESTFMLEQAASDTFIYSLFH